LSQENVAVRLLVIEDNPKLSEQLARTLEGLGYDVDLALTGHEGEEKAASGTYDVIILDILLPDHDGIQLCKDLRQRRVFTPIVMLSDMSATSEKVAGLDAGADDCLTKPFDLDELIARVRALVRRANWEESTTLQFEDVEMDSVKRSVTRAGKPISLTHREFILLEFFLRNPNRVLTRSLIGERVWDFSFVEESNVIEAYVARLRNKIEKGFDKPLIHTVVGTGYVLSGDGPPD